MAMGLFALFALDNPSEKVLINSVNIIPDNTSKY